MGNYADPRVEDLTVLVAFKYADIPTEDQSRAEIEQDALDAAERRGQDAEVLTEEKLAEEVRWAIRTTLSPTSASAWPLTGDYERIVQAVVERLLG